MKKTILTLALLTLTSAAFADICGIVTQDQLEKSLSFLTPGTKLTQTFSANSNLVVKNVTTKIATVMDGITYYDLQVNGESIDPGHTNIEINRKVSLNLGRLVGCDKDASDPDIIIGTRIN
jgi:hypothetical protein